MLRALRGALDDFRDALRGAEALPPAPAESTVDVAAAPLAPAADPSGAAAEAAIGEAAADAGSVTAPAAAPARRPRWRTWVAAVVLVGVVIAAVLRWAPWTPREPADPTVVAAFQGGTVTKDRLARQWQALPPAERPIYQTVAGLKALIGHLVVDETTRRWAEERQVDQQQAFREAMKHVTEEIQLGDVADQLHQGRIPVGEAEIQAYYDQNRQRFGDRPLVEVREPIRRAVVEQKERAFIDDYVKELRERASLQIDYGLLDTPEPTEPEILGYYEVNREQFRAPEQATIVQIQVSASLAGGDAPARAKAEAARARAAAGEDFAQLARALSDAPDRAVGGEVARLVERGARAQAFDEAVFPLSAGALAPVFKEGDSYYVVKLVDRRPDRLRPYEEVREAIAGRLRAEREQQLDAERRDRTLFTIHARRTTLGEFLQELSELPPEARAQYAGPAGRRQLLDALITRLLIVEDAAEQAIDAKRGEEIQHERVGLLSQLLHQEQVDDKVSIGDAEVRAEYEREAARYAEPARVKVAAIRVSRGATRDADQQARTKIEEAARKLRPSGFFGLGNGPPADFAEVARQYSEDADAAEYSAWLGESGDPMTEAFDHALHVELLPLQAGDVSRVMPLDDSYYLFHVIEKQEARPRAFEEAAPLIRRALEGRKHEELTRTMEAELAQRIQLQIYDRRLEALLAELGGPATGTTR